MAASGSSPILSMWSEISKSEIQNKSEILKSKFQTARFEILNLFRISCFGFLFFFTGCAAWKPIVLKTPATISPEMLQYYDYPKIAITPEILSEIKTGSYALRKIIFPLVLPESLKSKNWDEEQQKAVEFSRQNLSKVEDNTLRYLNRVELYLPRDLKPGEKRPAILISPILGGNMVVDHFARYYAGRGFIAVLVYRKKISWDDERPDIGQMEDYLRVCIIRLRQTVDWMSVQPEIDADRIGAFGVSYGAILHAVLAAVEPRIRYHVLAMPAGPVADVVMHCPEKQLTKIRKHVKEKYGWTDQKIAEDLKRAIKTDPVIFAPYVDRRRVQVYVALFDRVVGAGRSFYLWKALGKPDLKILPFGHYGGVLVFPWLQTQSYSAFKKHLK